MGERAEGFWWVRYGGDWTVVLVEPHYSKKWQQVRYPGVEEASDMAYAEQHEIREWGPYIGKDPDHDHRIKALQSTVDEALSMLPPGDGTLGTNGLVGRLRMLGYHGKEPGAQVGDLVRVTKDEPGGMPPFKGHEGIVCQVETSYRLLPGPGLAGGGWSTNVEVVQRGAVDAAALKRRYE